MHQQKKSLWSWMPWIAAVVSAGLLELPFPLAGPMPSWRALFAWIGLVPLLWALLSGWEQGPPRARRAFRLAYLCGVLWYAGNCYWIYDTMHEHGGLPPVVSLLLLIGFSLVLALYFGLFGLAVYLVRRATGRVELALAAAPVFWVALDLAAARITSVPWDQLGYSQVDNALLTELAPMTGVYGITFVLVAGNALLAGALLPQLRGRRWALLAGIFLVLFGVAGLDLHPSWEVPTETAVLVQPNLDVGGNNNWSAAEWERQQAAFTKMAQTGCKEFIEGIPETGAQTLASNCDKTVPPALVVWPESPAPFVEDDPRFKSVMAAVATTTQAPLIVGGIGLEFDRAQGVIHAYNSGMIFSAAGAPVGRYDKIHLVPYGEYIPYKELFSFAHKLTGRVSEFARGTEHQTFRLNGHRYGIFICYEAVFADEVRHEAQLGAEVLVNLSDDGWYGDTSAPWQHLNITRMRAIENRRWILRATNNGVTASIDPEGRVRQSIPRHAVDVLPARFGFRNDLTFYTTHGDLFAWLCVLAALGVLARAGKRVWRGRREQGPSGS